MSVPSSFRTRSIQTIRSFRPGRAPGEVPRFSHLVDTPRRLRQPGRGHTGTASLARSYITLSSLPIKRKRLRQRFGPVSVSDQSHAGHLRRGPSQAGPERPSRPRSRAVRPGRRALSRAGSGPSRARSRASRPGLRGRQGPLAVTAGARAVQPGFPAAPGCTAAPGRPARAARGGQQITCSASGTARNSTRSRSPTYSPSIWNAVARPHLSRMTCWSCSVTTLLPPGRRRP